ncbi:unnamed protein product, partial [Lymnaea stagnalis]
MENMRSRIVLIMAGTVFLNSFQTQGLANEERWRDFFSVTRGNLAMVPLPTARSARSRVECAVSCLRQAPSCQSFLYDVDTNHCALGSGIKPSAIPQVPESGLLYYPFRSLCVHGTEKFTLFTNGNTGSCLWLSKATRNYTDSRAACQAFGAEIYTAKNPEKVQIMLAAQKVFGVDEAWIGLDDIQEEGVFRWVDDGSIFNTTG